MSFRWDEDAAWPAPVRGSLVPCGRVRTGPAPFAPGVVPAFALAPGAIVPGVGSDPGVDMWILLLFPVVRMEDGTVGKTRVTYKVNT